MPDGRSLSSRFQAVRARTEALAAPLSPEDQLLQSMPDASPVKWHRAHTTWFFETFLLLPLARGWAPVDESYGYLFNSYYESVGPRHARPARGMLSRPSAAEVEGYRRRVDEGMLALLDDLARAGDEEALARAAALVEIGLAHEEQHQELLLTDVLHAFAQNPTAPAYRQAPPPAPRSSSGPARRLRFEGGLVEIGHGGDGFAFDNEGPRHKVFLRPFSLESRLVTCGEYLAFVEDGGYARPELWLSDGWDAVRALGWEAPLYWRRVDGVFRRFTLHGLLDVDLDAPVCHLSHYEADAYARWAGARLPTEAEWETAAPRAAGRPRVLDDDALAAGVLAPRPAGEDDGLSQMFGDCWEWTASAYLPHPGYRAPDGALGEYNGKFMSGQMVLKGGSCFTPPGHVRASYRNFFPPRTRWQMSGLRLARDE